MSYPSERTLFYNPKNNQKSLISAFSSGLSGLAGATEPEAHHTVKAALPAHKRYAWVFVM